MFNGQEQGFATELSTCVEIFDALTITSYGARVIINAKATNSTSRIRDDAADVANTIITITASTTGWFEVTGISEIMATGSVVCLEVEGTGAGAIRVNDTITRLNK